MFVHCSLVTSAPSGISLMEFVVEACNFQNSRSLFISKIGCSALIQCSWRSEHINLINI